MYTQTMAVFYMDLKGDALEGRPGPNHPQGGYTPVDVHHAREDGNNNIAIVYVVIVKCYFPHWSYTGLHLAFT